MNILIVNDEEIFGVAFQNLLLCFPFVNPVFAHMYAGGSCEIHNTPLWAPASLGQALGEADVIFLDHTMPIPGDIMLQKWRDAGINLSEKRIVGTSSHGTKAQPYVKEHFVYLNNEQLKDFLGV